MTDEQLYPNLQGQKDPAQLTLQGQKDPAQLTLQSTADGRLNYMTDNLKRLREKHAHYKRVKDNWSITNTVLKITGISVSCVLAGASILTVSPFSVPIVAAILGGISIGNISLSNLLIEGFTSKRKRYFRLKCDRINEYLK